MVPLIGELQRAGHDVLWATRRDGCAMLERYGFRALSATAANRGSSGMTEQEIATAAALPARERRLAVMPTMFGRIGARHMRDGLVPIVDEYRPDVVIHDLVDFAAAPIASARGIPHVTLAFGTALPPLLLQAVAAAVADLWVDEGLVPSADVGLYDHLYLHPLPPTFGETPTAPAVRRMRPMHYDGSVVAGEPGWIHEFGRDRPGVYITFGTVMAGGAPWGALVEAVNDLEADVVMTVGTKFDAASLGVLPDNVRVEGYVPQTHLLSRAAVVVSHAGSGTMFAAAARRIPQLCLPMGADQWENADALARSGAGLTLEPDERNPDRVRTSLLSLLDGGDHKYAAMILADDFAALPHPSAHVPTIESLI